MVFVELPQKYLENMEALLGEEYRAFLASLEEEPKRGIRVNPLKMTAQELGAFLPLEPSPFSPLSFYVGQKVGQMPLHWAGAFYAQEPSASSAVTVLAPEPGDRVLDLCAAPGGKSTQIAALLKGKGLIWSNEVVRSRANILLSNMERMGVRNSVVSSAFPEVLCHDLEGFFDKVLVDAPCSGEGMFRKNPEAVREWSPEHVESCARRQRAILDCAAGCVRQGGVLVYSTCTFSPEENEETVAAFLREHPEFEQEKIEAPFGRPGLDGKSLRIFPMDGGEGHFVARLIRAGENPGSTRASAPVHKKQETAQARELYEELFLDEPFGVLTEHNGKFLLLPDTELPQFRGLGVLRAGVPLGERAGKRIEPHHGLFMAQRPSRCRRVLNLAQDGETVLRYLRGEEIPCEEIGYAAVCVEGVTLGFGKASGGTLKNKYPKGLRFI